jgi:hypothetical protein
MIERSRAAVVTSVFHVAAQSAAWSANRVRPAVGET